MLAALSVVLAGCGASSVVTREQTQSKAASDQFRQQAAALSASCKQSIASTDLDAIRDKVELSRSATTAVPVAMLVLTAKPTDAEKAALLIWSADREQCAALLRTFFQTFALPQSMPPAFQQQVHQGFVQFEDKVTQAVNYLIAGLYEGDLTYGEFNKKRAEADSEAYTVFKAWARTMDSQDSQRIAAEAAAAQAQLDAFASLAYKLGCAAAKGRYAQALCN